MGNLTGSHSYVGGRAAAVVAGEVGAIHQGAMVPAAAGRVSSPAERYWGQHRWARGYLCATVGAVDERTIMEYVENQKWEDDANGFKITAPPEPA